MAVPQYNVTQLCHCEPKRGVVISWYTVCCGTTPNQSTLYRCRKNHPVAMLYFDTGAIRYKDSNRAVAITFQREIREEGKTERLSMNPVIKRDSNQPHRFELKINGFERVLRKKRTSQSNRKLFRKNMKKGVDKWGVVW